MEKQYQEVVTSKAQIKEDGSQQVLQLEAELSQMKEESKTTSDELARLKDALVSSLPKKKTSCLNFKIRIIIFFSISEAKP